MHSFLCNRVALSAVVVAVLAACSGAAPTVNPSVATQKPLATSADPGVLTLRSTPDTAAPPDYLAQRVQQQTAALNQATPVILRSEGLDDKQRIAQEAAIRDGRFTQFARAQDGSALRNEIFQIYPARDSDLTD